MKMTNQFLAMVLTVIFIAGCAGSSEERSSEILNKAYKDERADSIMVTESSLSSSAAVEGKDTSRKFIRTAEIKFRVKDVKTATFKIEDVIAGQDGFVTYTNLTSNIDRTTIVPISADSSLESIYYTVVNDMIIRVPNVKLDSSLKAIAKLMDYLDYRIIKAEDVSLNIMANKMAERRLGVHEKRLTNAIDNRGKKLIETTVTEEELLNKQMLSDKVKIENMNIQDQISFSTIRLNIYQRQAIKRTLILNDRNIESYTPGLLHRVKEAIEAGWRVFEYIIVFIAQLWSVLLIGIAMFFLVKRLLEKKK